MPLPIGTYPLGNGQYGDAQGNIYNADGSYVGRRGFVGIDNNGLYVAMGAMPAPTISTAPTALPYVPQTAPNPQNWIGFGAGAPTGYVPPTAQAAPQTTQGYYNAGATPNIEAMRGYYATQARPNATTPSTATATGTGTGQPSDPLGGYKNLAAYYGVDWNVLHEVYLKGATSATDGEIKRGIANAWEDGQWAKLFAEQNNGRAPNEVEWKEHWYAKQSGINPKTGAYYARDPLVEPGHPNAIAAWNQITPPPPPGAPTPQVQLAGSEKPLAVTPQLQPQQPEKQPKEQAAPATPEPAPQAQPETPPPSPYGPGQALLDQIQKAAIGF